MYRDPQKLRSKRISMSLPPEEYAYLEALADLTGAQLNTLARGMLSRQIIQSHAQLLADFGGEKVPAEGDSRAG